MKRRTCPGYDEEGKPMPCDNLPGTAWTPVWCVPCDERRRARLSRQFEELLGSMTESP